MNAAKEAIPLLITLYNQSGRKEPFIFSLYDFIGITLGIMKRGLMPELLIFSWGEDCRD